VRKTLDTSLERIAALYAIEKDIRGLSAEERRTVRQERSRPIIDNIRAAE
jgi:transposase